MGKIATRAVLFLAAILGITVGCAANLASAQTFPDHPIRIIVPNAPGGGFDTVARVMADRLTGLLGQAVIVENRPGAGTLVGSDYAAKAAPDGYTLLLGGTSNMALNLGLYQKLSYDPVKDFTPISIVVSWPFMLVARKDLPYKNLGDLIADARSRPNTITYGSAGVGSGQHVAAAAMAYLAGVNLIHVPYAGAQAAYTDILGGRVDLLFDNAQTALPQVRAGVVRALAVSSAKRYAAMPDLPTVMETGLAKLDMETWFGLFAPAKTPAPVLERLRAAAQAARASPEVINIFTKTGGTMQTMNTDETESFVKREAERWSKLLRDAGIKAE